MNNLIGNDKKNLKPSARKRASVFIEKLKVGVSPDDLLILLAILLDWGQEHYEHKSMNDKKVFFELFYACEKSINSFIPEGGSDDIKEFIRGVFFSLSRSLEIEERAFTGALKGLLRNYIGEGGLLVKSPTKVGILELNVPYLKYMIWSGIEIEEDMAIFDLLRFMAVIIPNDNGLAFGYSGFDANIEGNGVTHSYKVEISIKEQQSDIDILFLEKSLTMMVKLIKRGYDDIREDDGDIGWVEGMAKFYEKCNDPTYLTKKIGLRLNSLYQRHKNEMKG